MNQTAGLPIAESTLADSLLARVATIVSESSGKYELIEKLGSELGLGGATTVWYCAKYDTAAAKAVGEASCAAEHFMSEEGAHRRATNGCGPRVLLPAKIS